MIDTTKKPHIIAYQAKYEAFVTYKIRKNYLLIMFQPTARLCIRLYLLQMSQC